jgi:succinate dehydrogenase / fumarate reductase cytochrome b subunit
MHRASGLIMFLLMPFIIWMFDTSLSSEISFARFTGAFTAGIGFVPGIIVKLVALALIWAYLHHFLPVCATSAWIFHTVSKEAGKSTAQIVLVLSLSLTLALGAKLFGCTDTGSPARISFSLHRNYHVC